MSERATKTVHYKYAQFTGKGPTLEFLLRRALDDLTTFGKRKRNVSASTNGTYWEVLGDVSYHPTGFVFGTLMTYTPGMKPLYLVDDSSAKTVTLEQFAAPARKDGKHRELLESALYFGVVKNHLVVLQSSGLRTNRLEEHLAWLLKKCSNQSGNRLFQLVDRPAKKVRERFTKNPNVRSIKFGTELVAPEDVSSTQISEETVDGVIASTDMEEQKGLWQALKAYLDPAKVAQLNLDALSNANIQLTVELRYWKKTTKSGQDLMNSLGAAFRHADDVDLELNLVGGGKIKGSDLKLNGTVRITTYDGQPNPSEVYTVIAKWLTDKTQDQDVQE